MELAPEPVVLNVGQVLRQPGESHAVRRQALRELGRREVGALSCEGRSMVVEESGRGLPFGAVQSWLCAPVLIEVYRHRENL